MRKRHIEDRRMRKSKVGSANSLGTKVIKASAIARVENLNEQPAHVEVCDRKHVHTGPSLPILRGNIYPY